MLMGIGNGMDKNIWFCTGQETRTRTRDKRRDQDKDLDTKHGMEMINGNATGQEQGVNPGLGVKFTKSKKALLI